MILIGGVEDVSGTSLSWSIEYFPIKWNWFQPKEPKACIRLKTTV